MRKIIIGLLMLALVGVTATPAAQAAHVGTCTHEYVEIGIGAYGELKTGGAKGAASYVAGGAKSCADSTVRWICHGCLAIDSLLP